MTVALLLVASVVQARVTLLVTVMSEGTPVPQAEVSVWPLLAVVDARGAAELAVEAGVVTVVVSRFGFEVETVQVTVAPGVQTRVVVELEAESVLEEEVIVTATRSDRRIEEVPIRVEVVPSDEVQEKIMMTPGDISMLLAETNGLRLQTTSPSLGGASVRIQGLRGRYTQTLADGLPLFGSTGSIGLLQIPPMDLGQVEVVKGVASALYGASAVGGVINLVSRRPRPDETEREVPATLGPRHRRVDRLADVPPVCRASAAVLGERAGRVPAPHGGGHDRTAPRWHRVGHGVARRPTVFGAAQHRSIRRGRGRAVAGR